MEDLFTLYNSMEHNNIMLSFKGTVTADLMTSVLSIMESKMDSLSEAPKKKRKVFNVLVECLQNLYHHIDTGQDKTEEELSQDPKSSAIFMITRSAESYKIMTGNFIETSKIDMLRAKLDKINAMSKVELKEHYKEILSQGQFSDKGTAGLGMIDIARKSGQKLGYNFRILSSENSFFTLTVRIH